MREKAEISKTLSTLNAIISGLAKGEDPATLPFRDSKITRLLKKGLVNVSPCLLMTSLSLSDD